jgi:hypothetical protein
VKTSAFVSVLLCSLAPAVVLLVPAKTAQADATCSPSGEPFARGYCRRTQCAHGQWVRGSASVKNDGTVQAALGLETDNSVYGICGHAEFTFKDAAGKVVGTAKTAQKCIPGKAKKARIVDFPAGTTRISPENAVRIQTVDVSVVSCDRHPFGAFGFNLDPITFSTSWTF